MEKYFALIPAVFVALVVTFGVLLLFGKAAVLIPGYNITAKGEKAKFFERIFCRFVGVFVLVSTVFFCPLFVGIILRIQWLTGVSAGLGVCYFLFGYIYLYNNPKVKEAADLARILTCRPDYLDEYNIDTSKFDKYKKHEKVKK